MAYEITVIILVVLCMAFLILGIYSAQHSNGAIAFFSGLFFGKISTNLHYSIKKQQKANRTIRLMNSKHE